MAKRISLDRRIDSYCKAAQSMMEGRFRIEIPLEPADAISELGRALIDLGRTLEAKFDELNRLVRMTERINAGLLLDEVLDYIFEVFRPMIPYDRIGLSLLNDVGDTVVARYARSEAPKTCIERGYQAKLKGSSLERIIRTGNPRILNDLPAYLIERPQSESTRRIVDEGMRSSLTCPLIAMGKPIGFIFFSSMQTSAYANVHVDLFLQIAGQLSTIIEKSRIYEHLLELNQLKNKFLGIAAHDMRSPLSSFVGYLSLLMEGVAGEVPPAQLDLLRRMRRQTNSMMTMLNELLDISAIESGKLTLKPRPVPLGEFLEEIRSANEMMAQSKSIELRLNAVGTLPELECDPERIGQVLNNLIGNAIKFSNPGTTVTLAARSRLRTVSISVADHGLGIPQEELPTLFRDFGKGSTRPTAGESSTGLGLAIVKRIVEAHGGSVKAQSRPDCGSTFSVVLPLHFHSLQ